MGFDVDNTAGSALDSFLRLFDDTGAQITFSDDNAGPAPEVSIRESYLEHTFTSSGDFFIGISGFGNQTYDAMDGTGDNPATNGIGGFTLTVLDLDVNDQISEAEFISIGSTSSTFRIASTRDVDLFEFTATAGQIVGLDIDNVSGSALDAEIRLFDSAGVELAMDDDTDGPSPEVSGLESFLEHTFTTAGTYYLGVTHFSNDSYDINTGLGDDGSLTSTSIGQFTFTLTDVDPLVVTTTADTTAADGLTSLREAITFANSAASPGADTITFDASLTGQTVNVTAGELDVTDSLTIVGLGQSQLTINGDQSSRLFDVNLGAGEHFTVEDITLQNGGDGTARGGAIHSPNAADINVTRSALAGHQGSTGGAIRSNGNVTIDASTISGNTATNSGGAIFIADGVLDVLNGSTLGGDTVAEANQASNGNGGAIRADSGAIVTIDASTISGNTATNSGGGISVNFGSTINVFDSTITDNQASQSGGLEVYSSTVTVTNSTISGNTATTSTSALLVFGTGASGTIKNSTFANNTGGLRTVRVEGNSNFIQIENSIFDSTDPNLTAGAGSTITSLGHNISNDATGNLTAAGDMPSTDPQLGPLADNGGPTLTHALLEGSPAINAGDPAARAGVGDTPQFDQRGAGFDRVFGGRLDIGAFEVQAFANPLCDFNIDTVCDIDDIELFYDELGGNDSVFDLDSSGIVDNDDLTEWLSQASAVDPLGRTFLRGDANLDGSVGGSDFTALAANFGGPGGWAQGNFVVDPTPGGGVVGGSDFTALAANFGFTSNRPALTRSQVATFPSSPPAHRIRDIGLSSLFGDDERREDLNNQAKGVSIVDAVFVSG